MTKVRKAIIPVAGLGTRFLPVTKTVPKEMLPIIDKPLLLFNVQEAAKAGIEDIVLITGRNKGAIEDFFDVSYELEDKLLRDGKDDWLKQIREIRALANIISVRQKQPLGLGHAILCGQSVVGHEPFAVLLGDEIMISKDKTGSETGTLIKAFSASQKSTVTIMTVAESEVSKYGIVEGERRDGVLHIQRVIEKPKASETTSRSALPGRYVFKSELFGLLKKTPPGKNGEIQLTDAMTSLAQNDGLQGLDLSSRRFDAGDRLGYLQANVELGLEHPEIGSAFRAYLKNLTRDGL